MSAAMHTDSPGTSSLRTGDAGAAAPYPRQEAAPAGDRADTPRREEDGRQRLHDRRPLSPASTDDIADDWQAAILRGARFYTGQACGRCGGRVRYTVSRECQACAREKARRRQRQIAPQLPIARPARPARPPSIERETRNPTTKRACLCCRQTFLSEGPHNRLCGYCRRQNDGTAETYSIAGARAR